MVLTVTVEAKVGDNVAYIVELKQAGLFVIRNCSAEDLKKVVGSVCPGSRCSPTRAPPAPSSSRRGDSRSSCCLRSILTRCSSARCRARSRPRTEDRVRTRLAAPHEPAMTASTQAATTADVMVVLGAGSWGTALAIQFARAGRPVRLWGRDGAQLAALELDRCNRRYLPDARFPDSLQTEPDLAAAIADSQDVVLAVPSQALRPVLEQLRPLLRRGMGIAWATKGLEQESGKLPHQVVQEVLGEGWPMAVLSGPDLRQGSGRRPANRADHRLFR